MTHLLEDRKPATLQTMRALQTIMASCDRAIAKTKPVNERQELQKAILQEFKEAGRIDSTTWYDFTVIFVPDRDENGPYCSEVLALETNDGVQHFAPYDDLKAEFNLPTEEDITEELRS